MTTLLRVDERKHERILTGIGAGFVLFCALAFLLYSTVINPSGRPAENTISVAIDTPYVGQGVDDGTSVILHGLKVGEVKNISKLSDSRVRVNVDLDAAPTKGLTDAVGIDFRPANYFGITGINLVPADHGEVLRNGSSISVTPTGNFTLQTLLYRLGELSHDVITPQLISVVDRATRYTDALNPLFETMILVSTAVTDVQSVSTEQLLRNATAISVGLPSFLDGAISAGQGYIWNAAGVHFDPEEARAQNPYLKYYSKEKVDYFNAASADLAANPDKFIFGRLREYFKGAKYDLFSKMGDLEGSHTFDLFPVVDQVRVMADVVPRLVDPADLGDKLGELRSRLERMYAGSGDQHALQVRIVLDQLPGVAAPLNVMLGDTQ
ncbi:putative Mce family protein [Mycolicibacterium farcinogenes]|uniref:Mce family protein n=1 Tax=Mycolicibacterium senegalense TaxID=1796 RepID=A0A378W5G0_9MYCO|nr:putative Mce family protein [Mycolicibacterium farcinogenes]SUA27451.1 Mce family protein [Mycolicibacterium senegalense]